jgi:hypothetical protein
VDVLQIAEKDFESLIKGKKEELEAYLREVISPAPIDATNSEIHSYMLRLDGNGRARTNDFAVFLSNKIIDYCIPMSQIKEAKEKDALYNTTAYTLALGRKARDLFTDLPKTGEGGELLLYLLTQNILSIPQLLCKMPLKTSSEVHYHGSDGIYGRYDDECKKLTLYWGESKLYTDICDAMTDCLESIKPFLTEEGVIGRRKERDMVLFRDGVDLSNPDMQAAILEFLNPDEKAYLNLQYRGVCLVGYDDKFYPTQPNTKTEDDIIGLIANQKNEWNRQLATRLKYRKLESFILKIFIVPFASVEEFRQEFLRLVG